MLNAQFSLDGPDRISRILHNLLPVDMFRNHVAHPATLEAFLNYYQIPSVSIAVIDDFQIAWTKTAGVLDASGNEPVTPETLFQGASISKPVSAIMALRLVEQGVLGLDEDVNTRLISWKIPPTTYQGPYGNETWQSRVTLRQLLSHTAGLSVHGFPGYTQEDTLPTLLDILDGRAPANTRPIRVDTLPGFHNRYSGGGYCILRQLLTDRTGLPFPQLARELVLDPLGMHDSTFEQPLPSKLAKHAATAHRSDKQPITGKWHIYPEMAPDGLWSTATDIARFAIALQLAHVGRENSILSQSMARQLFTPQSLQESEEPCGLGVFVYGEGENARFGHDGHNDGFSSSFIAYQQRGQGAVVMNNSDADLIHELFNAIAVEYQWPDYLPTRPRLSDDPSVRERYVGTYATSSGLRFTLISHADGLFLTALDQPALRLFPRSENDYFAEAIDAEISFVKAESGAANGLLFRQNGRELRAEKQAESLG
jgi:CubicO group peptidase (beta-lactamase class C family)